MAQTAIIKIVLRRGTLAQWTTANPVLLHGEIGYVTDGNYFVIGDGGKTFIQLSPSDPNVTSFNRYRSEAYIVQNLLTPIVNAWNNALTTESNQRINADTVLTNNLNSEIQLRANADINLQQQITNEVNARTNADTALNSYILTVESNLNASIASLETNVQTWYGIAQNKGDILAYDTTLNSFNVLPQGDEGQVLTVRNAETLGLAWEDLPVQPINGDMTKAVYDTDDDGIVDASEREQIEVINKTGATLTKGTIVYIKSSSSSSTHPEVLKASALTEATSTKTIGAVYEDIPNNNVGYIITSGQVHNLNTSAYAIGTKLWLSTTAGQVTNVPPTQPYHTVFIGYVTRSQSQNGRVVYAIQNGYELEELHNVYILPNPQDGDVLVYDSGSGMWIRNSISNILGYTPADEQALVNGLALKENVIPSTTTDYYYRGDKSWAILDKNAVGLSNVDNTSDINKPISTATQTALNTKEPTITGGTTAQYWRGDKSWQTLDKNAVGLDQVDNTSDADKPISTATQTELDNKVPYTGATANVDVGENTVISNGSFGTLEGEFNYLHTKHTEVVSGNYTEITYNGVTVRDLLTPAQVDLNINGITFADSTVQSTAGITALTTIGTSGASTLVNGTLNIPQYSGGGGGGVSQSDAIAYAIALG